MGTLWAERLHSGYLQSKAVLSLACVSRNKNWPSQFKRVPFMTSFLPEKSPAADECVVSTPDLTGMQGVTVTPLLVTP